jgi:hypothetical protein
MPRLLGLDGYDRRLGGCLLGRVLIGSRVQPLKSQSRHESGRVLISAKCQSRTLSRSRMRQQRLLSLPFRDPCAAMGVGRRDEAPGVTADDGRIWPRKCHRCPPKALLYRDAACECAHPTFRQRAALIEPFALV